MKRKINIPIIFITFMLMIIFAIAGAFIIRLTIDTLSLGSKGTQVRNHIGYFDEDKKEKLSNKTNNEEATSKKLIKASGVASERKNTKTAKFTSKQKTKPRKLTKVQKAVKNNPELNNGEWLPSVKD